MFRSLLLLVILASCGDPIGYFYDEVGKYGYHPYLQPLEDAGLGTIVSGNTKRIGLVAPSDECFPILLDRPLRKQDRSTFPYRSQVITVDSDIRFKFLDQMANSAPSIRAGAKIHDVKQIEFVAKGIHIEYFNSIRLLEYYMQKMSGLCKNYLQGDDSSFVTQVIRIDSMEFSFLQNSNNRIYIDLENINQYLDFSADVKWKIVDNYKLIIETPKYVAYQLAKIKKEKGKITLYRTDSQALSDWHFYKVVTIDENNIDLSIYSSILEYKPIEFEPIDEGEKNDVVIQ